MDPDERTKNTLLDEDKLRRLSIHGLESSAEDCEFVKRTLQDVLNTFKSPRVSSAHAAAAVSALCALADRLRSSKSSHISSECLSEHFQAELFSAYLQRSDSLNAKPARRLLATATNLALGSSHDFLKRLRSNILTDCVDALRGSAVSISVKASLQVLDIFLDKLLVTTFDILLVDNGTFLYYDTEPRAEQTRHSVEELQAAATQFALQTFTWIRFPDCAPVISRFIPRFFGSLDSFISKDIPQKDGDDALWLPSVKQALEEDPDLLEAFEHFVLPGLLSLKSTSLRHFQDGASFQHILNENYGQIEDADLQICLLVAKLSKRSGQKSYVSGEQAYDYSQPEKHQADHDLPTTLGLILIEHTSPSVRLNALSLLISSKSASPFASDALACLKRCISYFHVEVEPKSRNEYIALMKTMAIKLRNIIRLLSRLDTYDLRKELITEQATALAEHLDFVGWYITYLISELRPTASYQSHITALKILPFFVNQIIEYQSSELLNLSVETKFTRLCDNASIRCILDLLVNPFDDVRQAATSVLEHIINSYATHATGAEFLGNLEALLKIALSRAEVAFRQSGRADHSDGFGRLHALLFGLRNSLGTVGTMNHEEILHLLLYELKAGADDLQHNFLEAIKMSSLHGYLIALRYIFNRPDLETVCALNLLQNIKTDILQCCGQLWVAVRNVLCYEAPEGHMIEEDNLDNPDTGSKDSLSFCWRALRESSLLMRSLIETGPNSIPDKLYKQYGDLIFSQLAELRHRGAFSTVAQTFAQWCVVCSQSPSHAVAGLPAHWYQDTLACIQIQSNALTRRSAGLPAMIVAVLASSTTSDHFNSTIWDLQAIADAAVEQEQGKPPMKLPQVHALNCLKDVFTDARFGFKTEPHIATTLSISISCLESNVWAIKNCGLMLLNSLLRRINGGGDTASSRISSSNRRGSPLVYEKYPLLPAYLGRILNDNLVNRTLKASILQKIFPALEIVERFGLPKADRQKFVQALKRYRESPSWAIREKAAKAMSYVLDSSRMLDEVQSLLVRSWSSQNELHGRLLCLRFFLDRVISEHLQIGKGTLAEIGSLMLDFEIFLRQKESCPINRTTLSDLINIRMKFLAETKSDDGSICSVYEEGLESETSALSQPLNSKDFGAAILTPGLDGDLLCFRRAQRPTHKSPSQYRVQLALFGGDVGKEVANSTDSRKLSFLIGCWTRALLFALDENSETADRSAATTSIEYFFKTLHQPQLRPTAAPEFFELFLVLYHVLIDDDSDIRRAGAKIVSSFLSKEAAKQTGQPTGLNLSPAAARPRLLKAMLASYSSTRALLLESVWKVTGMEKHIAVGFRVGNSSRHNAELTLASSSTLRLRTISNIIEAAIKEHKVVFEEEKQNLYIDPVSESDAWTQVALGMELTTWSPSLCEELRVWVVDGLGYLANSLTMSADGPLGLCLKQDVFSVFVQVLNAARLVLHSTKLISLQTEFERQESLQEELQRLWDVGREEDLHPMILDRVGHLRLGDIYGLPH